jgi:hypothetical protein
VVPDASTVIRADGSDSWHNRWFVPAVDLLPVVASSSFVGVVSAGDPGSSRLVYAMVAGLVVVGIALILLAIWILRRTRPDLEVLAPLERMGDSDWKKRDPSTQRRMLDEVRPEGAEPLVAEPPPPPLDDDFEQADHPVASFSDLGPGLGGGVHDTAATESEASGTDSDESADTPGDDSGDAAVDTRGDDSGDAAVDTPGDDSGDAAADTPGDDSGDESTEGPEDEPDDPSDPSVGDTSSDPRT